MRATDTKTLSGALRLLHAAIYGEYGAANRVVMEAADRVDDLAALATEMAGMLAHDRALPDGCKACAMQRRLAELGVEG